MYVLIEVYIRGRPRPTAINALHNDNGNSIEYKNTTATTILISSELISGLFSFQDAETSELCEAWVKVLLQSLSLKSNTPG